MVSHVNKRLAHNIRENRAPLVENRIKGQSAEGGEKAKQDDARQDPRGGRGERQRRDGGFGRGRTRSKEEEKGLDGQGRLRARTEQQSLISLSSPVKHRLSFLICDDTLAQSTLIPA